MQDSDKENAKLARLRFLISTLYPLTEPALTFENVDCQTSSIAVCLT